MQVSPCEAVWDMRLAAGKKRNATKGRRILWYLQVPFLKKNKKNIIKSEDWLYKEVTVIKSLTFRERENSHLPSGHYPKRSGLEVHDRRRNRTHFSPEMWSDTVTFLLTFQDAWARMRSKGNIAQSTCWSVLFCLIFLFKVYMAEYNLKLTFSCLTWQFYFGSEVLMEYFFSFWS